MTPKGFADEEHWMRGNRPGRNEENEYVFYFLENGYSSMLQQRAVHGKGRYVFHADCRWKGDFKNNKFSRVNLSFFDKNGKTVKTSSNAAVVLSRTAGGQNIDLDISVPKARKHIVSSLNPTVPVLLPSLMRISGLFPLPIPRKRKPANRLRPLREALRLQWTLWKRKNLPEQSFWLIRVRFPIRRCSSSASWITWFSPTGHSV